MPRQDVDVILSIELCGYLRVVRGPCIAMLEMARSVILHKLLKIF